MLDLRWLSRRWPWDHSRYHGLLHPSSHSLAAANSLPPNLVLMLIGTSALLAAPARSDGCWRAIGSAGAKPTPSRETSLPRLSIAFQPASAAPALRRRGRAAGG